MNVANWRGAYRRRLLPLVFGLIGGWGWAAGAEAQYTEPYVDYLRIQDRTAGRAADTEFHRARPTSASIAVSVPATVTRVQLFFWPQDNTYGRYTRAGNSGNWNPGGVADYNLSASGPTVLQFQIR